MPTNTPFVLIIRDGWGRNPHAEHDAFNAIKLAHTPVADALERDCPTTLIKTSGLDVGLPEGTMGNSEVGHQNIGAGRIVDQESVRITRACRDAKLHEIEPLVGAITGARDSGHAVHLMGINSDAGVHGLLEHLFALLDLCEKLDAPRVYIHLFTDGRDTGPYTGKAFAQRVESKCNSLANARNIRIASVIGRYWAMDRDSRWDRVEKAYNLLTGRGEFGRFETAEAAIQDFYDDPGSDTMKGDEFVRPSAIGGSTHAISDSRISTGDAVIFYNYRGDRPREICAAFLLPKFHNNPELKPSPDSGERGFDRAEKLDLNFVLMSAYSQQLAKLAPVAFPRPPRMPDIAGEYLSNLAMTQFRCAETEKYPHVTFFFNDYRDEPFEGERREIIQSPRVSTYDQQPEMSARGVCDAVLGRLGANDCEEMIVVNFANADMVGHTGNLDAAIEACQTVDACVGEIVAATLARNGSLIVTADHGNAEQMFDPKTGSPHTAHTTFDVPLFVVGEAFKDRTLREGGRLGDILPTAFDMMGTDKPEAMTGTSLLA